jgi:hypothetical protein
MLETTARGLNLHIQLAYPGNGREVPVNYNQIVSVLGYAGDHDCSVRIKTTGKLEVVGVPTSIDPDVEAHEVYLRPAGAEETEIAVSLAAIESVQLV